MSSENMKEEIAQEPIFKLPQPTHDEKGFAEELASCAHPSSGEKKPKRERKTEHAPGVPVSSRGVWNRIFVLLQSEAQCRDVSPLVLARLTSCFESSVAIVIGENNSDYNEIFFKGQNDVFTELNRRKLTDNPVGVTPRIFEYETKRPKRERDPSSATTGKNQRRKTNKAQYDSDSEDDDDSALQQLIAPPTQTTSSKPVVDSEGNVIVH